MVASTQSVPVKSGFKAPYERMTLDQAALDAARNSLEQGAVTPNIGPWRADIIQLLNDSLATVIVCVLRYRRRSPRSSWCMRTKNPAMPTGWRNASCNWAASPTFRRTRCWRAVMPPMTTRPT